MTSLRLKLKYKKYGRLKKEGLYNKLLLLMWRLRRCGKSFQKCHQVKNCDTHASATVYCLSQRKLMTTAQLQGEF